MSLWAVALRVTPNAVTTARAATRTRCSALEANGQGRKTSIVMAEFPRDPGTFTIHLFERPANTSGASVAIHSELRRARQDVAKVLQPLVLFGPCRPSGQTSERSLHQFIFIMMSRGRCAISTICRQHRLRMQSKTPPRGGVRADRFGLRTRRCFRHQYCPFGSSPNAYWPYMVLTASQLRLIWEAAAWASRHTCCSGLSRKIPCPPEA